MYERVIVPTDGSEIAERGVEKGLEVAQAMDVPALSIYVIDFSTLEKLDKKRDQKEVRSTMEKAGEKALREVRKKAHQMGVDIETRNLIGKPYKRIVDQSKENDMIFMSSHGASGFSELIFGSTTEKVLKEAECTVAVVKGK